MKNKWKSLPEFEALQHCIIKGGADRRALPYFIKWVESHSRTETIKEIKQKVDGIDKKIIAPLEYKHALKDILKEIENL